MSGRTRELWHKKLALLYGSPAQIDAVVRYYEGKAEMHRLIAMAPRPISPDGAL